MPMCGKVGGSLVGPGIDLGPGIPNVLVEGMPISVVGDMVAPHGEPPHSSPVLVNGSATVIAGGRPVTLQAISKASCGHSMITGAPTVQIGA
tara:strand:- start:2154 stop:2429 length:276 start_codon:yes stop_codon:yes gene_type:complete